MKRKAEGGTRWMRDMQHVVQQGTTARWMMPMSRLRDLGEGFTIASNQLSFQVNE